MRSSYVKPNSNKRVFWAGLILFIVAFIFWSKVRPVLYNIIETPLSGLISFNNSVIDNISIVKYFKNKSALQAELLNTQAKLQDSENKNNSLRVDIDRIILRLSMMRQGRIDSVEAFAIGSPNGTLYKSLILNRGYRDGIEDGALVYTDNLSVVGRVEEIYGKTCRVTLFSKDGNEVKAIIESSGMPIKLLGIGGGSYIGYIVDASTTITKYKELSEYASSTAVSAELNAMASSTRIILAEDKDLIIGNIVSRVRVVDENKIRITVLGDYDPRDLRAFYINK